MNLSMLKRPPVTPFVECPNCRRLLEYGLAHCPRCREEIKAEYALLSAAVVMHNTQACSMANTIKSGEPAAVLTLLPSAYAFAFGSPGLFIAATLTSHVALLVIGVWYYRYGRFRLGDEDYAKARRDVRASLKLWAALLAAQVVAAFYLMQTV